MLVLWPLPNLSTNKSGSTDVDKCPAAFGGEALRQIDGFGDDYTYRRIPLPQLVERKPDDVPVDCSESLEAPMGRLSAEFVINSIL